MFELLTCCNNCGKKSAVQRKGRPSGGAGNSKGGGGGLREIEGGGGDRNSMRVCLWEKNGAGGLADAHLLMPI